MLAETLQTQNRRCRWRVAMRVAVGVICLSAGGCNNALEGGLTGASLGALSGMGIGSLFGAMGKGAAIGAIAGGLGGAILGDQNARNSGGGSCDY